MLNFSYAELCESRKQIDEARQVYNNLIEKLDKDREDLKEATEKEIAKLQQEAEDDRASLNLSDDIDGEMREQLRVREKNVKKKQEEVRAKMNEEADIIARAGSLVWICYMRFARRTEVKGSKKKKKIEFRFLTNGCRALKVRVRCFQELVNQVIVHTTFMLLMLLWNIIIQRTRLLPEKYSA